MTVLLDFKIMESAIQTAAGISSFLFPVCIYRMTSVCRRSFVTVSFSSESSGKYREIFAAHNMVSKCACNTEWAKLFGKCGKACANFSDKYSFGNASFCRKKCERQNAFLCRNRASRDGRKHLWFEALFRSGACCIRKAIYDKA